MTFGTAKVSEEKITSLMREFFSLTPKANYRDAGFAAADLQADRGLRALRAHGAGIHLGEDGSRRGVA